MASTFSVSSPEPLNVYFRYTGTTGHNYYRYYARTSGGTVVIDDYSTSTTSDNYVASRYGGTTLVCNVAYSETGAAGSYTWIGSKNVTVMEEEPEEEEGYAKVMFGAGLSSFMYDYVHNGITSRNNTRSSSSGTLTLQCDHIWIHDLTPKSGYQLPWIYSTSYESYGDIYVSGSTSSYNPNATIYPEYDYSSSYAPTITFSFTPEPEEYDLICYWRDWDTGASLRTAKTYTSDTAWTWRDAYAYRDVYDPGSTRYYYDYTFTGGTTSTAATMIFYYKEYEYYSIRARVYSGNGSAVVSTSVMSSTDMSVKEGDSYSVTATPDTGWEFDSWVTSSGAYLSGSNPITATAWSDYTYYAKFSHPLYTITLKYVEYTSPSIVLSTQYIYNYYGSQVTLTDVVNRMPDGYTYYDASADFPKTITQDATITIYMKPITYTIMYYPNYGTGSGIDDVKRYNVAYTIRDDMFTRTGYTIEYWTTNSDGTGTKYYVGDRYTSNSSLYLYAHWKINTYNVDISYLNNSTSSQIVAISQTVVYNYQYTQSLLMYELEAEGYSNYVFVSSSPAAPITITSNRSITVYVKPKYNIQKFYWRTESTESQDVDGNYIYRGASTQSVSAIKWNALGSKINECEDALSRYESYFAIKAASDPITAYDFNAIAGAIEQLPGTYWGPDPDQSRGDTVYASYFVGTNSLKAEINRVVDYINNL